MIVVYKDGTFPIRIASAKYNAYIASGKYTAEPTKPKEKAVSNTAKVAENKAVSNVVHASPEEPNKKRTYNKREG